jgi:hypothetical protein
MQKTTVKIMKTTNVESPISLDEWCKKYKVGSRAPKTSVYFDMYKSKDYDFDKLASIIKNGSKKLSLYDRILKAITA